MNRKREPISRPVVIAVEGEDFERFIGAKLKLMSEFKDIVDIRDYKKKPEEERKIGESVKRPKWKLTAQIDAILGDTSFVSGTSTAFGIICDVEQKGRSSMNDSLNSVFPRLSKNYPTLGIGLPEEVNKIAVSRISTGYLIIPHGSETGCLEHAMLDACNVADRLQCANGYLDCLSGIIDTSNPNQQAKILVHSLLAGQVHNRASMTLGLSATTSLWDWNKPSLGVILEFIRNLCQAAQSSKP